MWLHLLINECGLLMKPWLKEWCSWHWFGIRRFVLRAVHPVKFQIGGKIFFGEVWEEKEGGGQGETRLLVTSQAVWGKRACIDINNKLIHLKLFITISPWESLYTSVWKPLLSGSSWFDSSSPPVSLLKQAKMTRMGVIRVYLLDCVCLFE